MDGGTDGRREGEVVRQTWSKSLTGLAEMRGGERERKKARFHQSITHVWGPIQCVCIVSHRNKGLRSYKLPISLQRPVNSLQPKEKWTADRVLLRECNDAWLIMMSNSK